jgi:hypothetical protein
MTKQQIPIVAVVLFSAFTLLPLIAYTTPEQRFEVLSGQNGSRSSDSHTDSDTGTILGTVTDVNDDPVAGASVDVQGPNSGHVYTATTNDNGYYEIHAIQPGIAFQVTIIAKGFARWESPVMIFTPGQHEILDVDKLRIEEVQTAITVSPETSEEIAIQQVKIEEQQRGFGIIPNFFEAYGPNAAPLTAKLKFNLSFRASRDPFTAAGIAAVAGGEQAARIPNYRLGAQGFAERFGATYLNQFTDVIVGGALLPSVLHQDPRYFYQGSGTKRSRALHALSSLVMTKGDNGRWQPNYSGVGGDLVSAAIANLYYPKANRGANLFGQNLAIDTAVHIAVHMLQEFVFRPTQGTTVSNVPGPNARKSP